MTMSEEQLAHVGALITAGEESALRAYDQLMVGFEPSTDEQRIRYAQALALTSYALTFNALSQANPTGEPASEPAPEPEA